MSNLSEHWLTNAAVVDTEADYKEYWDDVNGGF